MDREKCLYFFKKFYGIDREPISNQEIEEMVTEYICDRGHCDKKHLVPLMITKTNEAGMLRFLLSYIFDHYRRIFNIIFITKESLLDINGGQIILIY